MQSSLTSRFNEIFGGTAHAAACAPGRIEIIGNHTDYNGGTVMGAAIDRTVSVAVSLTENGEWTFASSGSAGRVVVPAGDLTRRAGDESWANYPLGVLQALAKRGMRLPAGLHCYVDSDLPSGAGLSSSAALELASALAFSALSDFSLSREELVVACREAENVFVGVPCGILDQGVSGFGRHDHLVHIDCRGPVFSLVPVPAGVRFWIFNTHSKHALVDSLYSRRHAECQQALELIRGDATNGGPVWLAEVSEESLEARKAELPDTAYRRARHVIGEVERVAAMRNALAAGDLPAAGRLLFDSHASSRDWFENSTPQLDLLVDLLTDTPGVFGARLTGGGFGGAVMAMTGPEFSMKDADVVAAGYESTFGERPDILSCQTADGAVMLSE